MFDDLDAIPPHPDESVRAAVRARADQLQRRRRIVQLSAAAGVAVAAVLVAQVVTPPDAKPNSLTVLTPDETSTPDVVTPIATETPTPAVSLNPSASPSRSPVSAISTAEPVASPTVTCDGGINVEACADGKPGWYAGFSSCQPSRGVSTDGGDTPLPGMTLTFTVPSATVAGGKDFEGELHITNGSDKSVELSIAPTTATADQFIADVFGPGGGGGVFGSDVVANQRIALAPGEVLTRKVEVPTTTCGDTSNDPASPLSAGRYAASVSVAYSDPVAVPDSGPSASASPGASPSPAPTSTGATYGVWSAATNFTITD